MEEWVKIINCQTSVEIFSVSRRPLLKTTCKLFNLLPYGKILNFPKFKAFADDK